MALWELSWSSYLIGALVLGILTLITAVAVRYLPIRLEFPFY